MPRSILNDSASSRQALHCLSRLPPAPPYDISLSSNRGRPRGNEGALADPSGLISRFLALGHRILQGTVHADGIIIVE